MSNLPVLPMLDANQFKVSPRSNTDVGVVPSLEDSQFILFTENYEENNYRVSVIDIESETVIETDDCVLTDTADAFGYGRTVGLNTISQYIVKSGALYIKSYTCRNGKLVKWDEWIDVSVLPALALDGIERAVLEWTDGDFFCFSFSLGATVKRRIFVLKRLENGSIHLVYETSGSRLKLDGIIVDQGCIVMVTMRDGSRIRTELTLIDHDNTVMFTWNFQGLHYRRFDGPVAVFGGLFSPSDEFVDYTVPISELLSIKDGIFPKFTKTVGKMPGNREATALLEKGSVTTIYPSGPNQCQVVVGDLEYQLDLTLPNPDVIMTDHKGGHYGIIGAW